MGGGPLPWSARLAHALVAFTIELDDEFERRLPHHTSDGRGAQTAGGPWLVSLAMYASCLQHVGRSGVRVAELAERAHSHTNLPGMLRWGYVVVDEGVVRATEAGRRAQKIWPPLFALVEKRWDKRFGRAAVRALRDALVGLVEQIDVELPEYLPILGHRLFTKGRLVNAVERADANADAASLPLTALLSRALIAFAVPFERGSPLSLAVCANVVRVLGEGGAARELSLRAGVSRPAVKMAMGLLRKGDVAAAYRAYRGRLAVVERGWGSRFGARAVDALAAALLPFDEAALIAGLTPQPENWRAHVRRPEALPHYPMVLHRGGYPDGS